jgi:hypothetical protein
MCPHGHADVLIDIGAIVIANCNAYRKRPQRNLNSPTSARREIAERDSVVGVDVQTGAQVKAKQKVAPEP